MSKLPLKRGDHGDLVKQMQGALIKKGFSCGPSATDGDFGKNTLSALEAFQDSAALTDIASYIVEIDDRQHTLACVTIKDDELKIVDLLLK